MPINVFHGVARKVAVLFAALSGIGWVACVVGCVADLVAGANPTSEPYYAAIVVGIMVYDVKVLQPELVLISSSPNKIPPTGSSCGTWDRSWEIFRTE